MSAPALYRSSTTFRWPPFAANHNGELPFLFFTSTWAPLKTVTQDIKINKITSNADAITINPLNCYGSKTTFSHIIYELLTKHLCLEVITQKICKYYFKEYNFMSDLG